MCFGVFIPVHDGPCNKVCFRDEAVWMHAKVPRHSGALSPVSALLGRKAPAILISVNTCSLLKARGRELSYCKQLKMCSFKLREAGRICFGST